MKALIFIFLFLLNAKIIHAQNIAGEYYLEGVMETASGFQLNSDSTFEFFFSYGALDRLGKGKWTIQNDSVIILNNDKRPPLDFKLEKQSAVAEKLITIRVDDNNKNILSYIEGFVKFNLKETPFKIGNDGTAKLENQQIDSIGLIFTLCPDRYSVFPVSGNNNHFLFLFEPWIADVFFENLKLKYSHGLLRGKHPLLNGNNYTYKKE